MKVIKVIWRDIWDTERLKVTVIKKGDRAIYTVSNPLTDDALNIEGKDLIPFAKMLLENEEVEG